MKRTIEYSQSLCMRQPQNCGHAITCLTRILINFSLTISDSQSSRVQCRKLNSHMLNLAVFRHAEHMLEILINRESIKVLEIPR